MKPNDKKDGSQSFLYLSQSKYKKIRPIIKKIIGRQVREVNKRVQKLIESGYLAYDAQKKEYTFPFDYNQKYYIVSNDVLGYLCTVSNPFVIKIYFYLADRFNYKHNYLFTLKQLRGVLGYSTSSHNQQVNNLLKVALSALEVMGFIEYQPVKVKGVGNTDRPVDEFMLKNVVGKELPKAIKEKLSSTLNIESQSIVSLFLP